MFSGWTRFFSVGSGEMASPAFYFSSLPSLETARLLLRPLRTQDAADIFSWASDPEVAKYVLWDPHRSVSETKSYLRSVQSFRRRGLPSSWAVVCRETGKVIGTIGFMWYSEANLSAEVGYSFARSCWNKGYATEALRSVLASAFSSLPVNRIEAQHDTRNPASGRVMVKCGMKKEGLLRQRIRNKGEFVDIVLYAVLRSDLEK